MNQIHAWLFGNSHNIDSLLSIWTWTLTVPHPTLGTLNVLYLSLQFTLMASSSPSSPPLLLTLLTHAGLSIKYTVDNMFKVANFFTFIFILRILTPDQQDKKIFFTCSKFPKRGEDLCDHSPRMYCKGNVCLHSHLTSLSITSGIQYGFYCLH